MSLPPVTLSSDPIEDLNLDTLAAPMADTFDKSDDPRSDACDRSTSPNSDAAIEPPATKEWPLLSFEKFVQHWLKGNDSVDVVGNEDKIEQMFQDYKKDYALVKPVLDTLIRFSVDNHENAHQMAHGIFSNLSLGSPLLTLNLAWTLREKNRAIAAAKTKEEEERKKAEEERKKAEAEVKARAQGAVDLLAKINLAITKAKANAKFKCRSAATAAAETPDDEAATSTNLKPDGKIDTSTDATADKSADVNVNEKSVKPKQKQKFVPYIPKYLLEVHGRKYCMNDALVTRGSVGDPLIVSCLAASARKCQARIMARTMKSIRGDSRVALPERRGAQWVGGVEKGESEAAVVMAEGVVSQLHHVEGSYPDGTDALVAEVVEGMMWM